MHELDLILCSSSSPSPKLYFVASESLSETLTSSKPEATNNKYQYHIYLVFPLAVFTVFLWIVGQRLQMALTCMDHTADLELWTQSNCTT